MNKSKNVLIILGQGDSSTYYGALADKYEKGARDAGHNVKRINVSEMQFDPILHHGYKIIQELEPDLLRLQNLIKWANHIAIFYPNWWGGMPAIFKGMWERMFLPGFAFKFKKDGSGWRKLLKDRSASIFVTLNTTPWQARLLFGDSSRALRKSILGFAGISPIYVYKFGPVEKLPKERLDYWKKKVYGLGKKGK
ncbi:NAD(P)H-dependent oxidoreductase [Patescibacteria group bacterium]